MNNYLKMAGGVLVAASPHCRFLAPRQPPQARLRR